MKLTNIKKFPFHTFLLPAFFVLHVTNQYFRMLLVQTAIEFFLYYIFMAALFLLTGKLIFKSLTKGGVWATCLLMLFFFFGAIHDFLINNSLTHFITPYKIFLPFLLGGFLYFSLYCKMKNKKIDNAGRYFTILFIILVSIEVVLILSKTIYNDQEHNFGLKNKHTIKPINSRDSCQKPDIFFIVFDEYASSSSLKQYFGFENSYCDSSLKRNNFFIAKNSKSNYNSTPLSIGSALNMQYFNVPLEKDITTARTMLQAWYSYKMSQLPDLLAQSGYAVYNFGIYDFKNHPIHTSNYFSAYESKPFYQETLYGRIERDILWNINKLNLPFIRKMISEKSMKTQTAFIARNQKNLQLILKELSTQNNQPKFIFGHILMPHAPFYFDRNGKKVVNNASIYNNENNAGPYLEQLIYTNTWIDSILNTTNRHFTRPRVVIIEGDHGYRESPPNMNRREMHFMNLNTYYFSDKDYTMLYDSISPVNTFRVVLNKYFNARLPLLKDSTVFLK